jgi:hypothetical protein
VRQVREDVGVRRFGNAMSIGVPDRMFGRSFIDISQAAG